MINGKLITQRPDGTERTDYLFRVSLKALIYDQQGRILVVKEHGLNWGLPGGGMDFDETFESALARELAEEVGYTGRFTFETIGVADPIHVGGPNVWQVWIVFHVAPETFDFSVGVDAEAMKFIDPKGLEMFDDMQARYAVRYHQQYQARNTS